MISVVAVAKARYSDFVELLNTTYCFFENQEMRFGPRKTHTPVVDLLSKAVRFRVGVLVNRRPCVGVPIKYLSSLLHATQCVTVGA